MKFNDCQCRVYRFKDYISLNCPQLLRWRTVVSDYIQLMLCRHILEFLLLMTSSEVIPINLSPVHKLLFIFKLEKRKKMANKNKLNHVVGAATIANCYFEPTSRIYRRLFSSSSSIFFPNNATTKNPVSNNVAQCIRR